MKAILNVADTGPLESLVVMLTSCGYECLLPDDKIKQELRNIGCDTVLDIENLVRGMGYERPFQMQTASLDSMQSCDLFVDLKAHRNAPRIWDHWHNLKDRVLWYRINGGEPERHPRYGNEMDLITPILTPNLWYREEGPWGDKAYSCWPPFYRFDEYFKANGRFGGGSFTEPICLIHNINGWGYGELINMVAGLGVRCYGAGSPDGLVAHNRISHMLFNALCMVHLKSNDAPGYALYEALASACPIIVSRTLIWRCKMEELFIPGETCLVFDEASHNGMNTARAERCRDEIKANMEQLQDCDENRRIGINGWNRLQELMWSDRKEEDRESLRSFFKRNFP